MTIEHKCCSRHDLGENSESHRLRKGPINFKEVEMHNNRRGGDIQLLNTRLCIKGLDLIPNLSAVHILRRHIVLLIAIRPSDGDVKPGGPLGAYRQEYDMYRYRVSASPFPSLSSYIQHTYITKTITHTVTLTSLLSVGLHKYRYTSPTKRGLPKKCVNRKQTTLTPSIRVARNPKQSNSAVGWH